MQAVAMTIEALLAAGYSIRIYDDEAMDYAETAEGFEPAIDFSCDAQQLLQAAAQTPWNRFVVRGSNHERLGEVVFSFSNSCVLRYCSSRLTPVLMPVLRYIAQQEA